MEETRIVVETQSGKPLFLLGLMGSAIPREEEDSLT